MHVFQETSLQHTGTRSEFTDRHNVTIQLKHLAQNKAIKWNHYTTHLSHFTLFVEINRENFSPLL